MEILTLAGILIPTGCVVGVSFIVRAIIKEEQEKEEKLAFIKAFSAKHNNNKHNCPQCGCIPCQCGS